VRKQIGATIRIRYIMINETRCECRW